MVCGSVATLEGTDARSFAAAAGASATYSDRSVSDATGFATRPSDGVIDAAIAGEGTDGGTTSDASSAPATAITARFAAGSDGAPAGRRAATCGSERARDGFAPAVPDDPGDAALATRSGVDGGPAGGDPAAETDNDSCCAGAALRAGATDDAAADGATAARARTGDAATDDGSVDDAAAGDASTEDTAGDASTAGAIGLAGVGSPAGALVDAWTAPFAGPGSNRSTSGPAGCGVPGNVTCAVGSACPPNSRLSSSEWMNIDSANAMPSRSRSRTLSRRRGAAEGAACVRRARATGSDGDERSSKQGLTGSGGATGLDPIGDRRSAPCDGHNIATTDAARLAAREQDRSATTPAAADRRVGPSGHRHRATAGDRSSAGRVTVGDAGAGRRGETRRAAHASRSASTVRSGGG